MSLAATLVWAHLLESIATAPALWADNGSVARTARKDHEQVSRRVPSAGLQRETPERVYHHAWTLISETLYDVTYNNQDWTRWEHRYDGKIRTFEDAHKAIQTMTASLGDPLTRTVPWNDETVCPAYIPQGIGVQLGYDRHNRLIVIAPLPDSPAARAGLLPGDVLLAVDGKWVGGLPIEQVSTLIRGQPNTPVNLLASRIGTSKRFRIRRTFAWSSKQIATVEMLGSNIGYIGVKGLSSEKQLNGDMKRALQLTSAAQGIILDLRDNCLGSIPNAVALSNIFLDCGVIFSINDRKGHRRSTQSTAKPACRKPVVVLINHGTTGPAEILSGALRDNGRAFLVGEETFGRAAELSVSRLPGSLLLIIDRGRYTTPKGLAIHGQGISPDYTVKLSPVELERGRGPWWRPWGKGEPRVSPMDGQDAQLKAAVAVMRNILENYSVKN